MMLSTAVSQRLLSTMSVATAIGAFALPLVAAPQTPAGRCTVAGRAMSGASLLPGVAILARDGATVKGATSTDVDGTYKLVLPAGATYRMTPN